MNPALAAAASAGLNNPDGPHETQAHAAAPRSPHPTRFDDLPAELKQLVAGHIFESATREDGYRVDSLACTPTLRSILSAELQADGVLQAILKAEDMPGLCAALEPARTVLPRYRNGCLAAAIQLLPRVKSPRLLPDGVWEQIHALLPAGEPRETLLLQLIRSLKQRPGGLHPEDFIRVVATLGAHSGIGSRLADMFTRCTAELLTQNLGGPPDIRTFCEELLAAAPRVLRARLERICNLAKDLKSRERTPLPITMNRQMMLLEQVRASGSADLSSCLDMVAGTWARAADGSPACKALYTPYFLRLPAEHQMRLLLAVRSPFRHDEIPAIVKARIGQAPARTLLKIMQKYEPFGADASGQETADLLRQLVQSAPDTAQLADLLHLAISRFSVQRLGLGPFFLECLQRVGEDDRTSLELRLEMAGSGATGPYGEAWTRRLEILFSEKGATHMRAVETFTELDMDWLTPDQLRRLLDRIQTLPPATGARVLARTIQNMWSLHSPQCGVQARKIVEVLAGLDPRCQAKPLAALILKLSMEDASDFRELRRACSRLYFGLAGRLRPVISMSRLAELQRPSPPAAARPV